MCGPPVACFSAGIRDIPRLEVFLGRKMLFRPDHDNQAAGAVLLWGEKENRSGRLARNFARDHDLPVVRLEDGFLRSLDLGCRGAAPLSLIVDEDGIYYDASRPSGLENTLNSSGWENPDLMAAAEKALAAVIAADLSKYNYSPPAPVGLLGDGSRRRVLIIDQTFGDKSIALGLAGPEDFQAMLEAAQSENPDADIFVKTHPDVIAGLKKGYLNPAALKPLKFIGQDYSPLSLLAQVDEVYTVTSQMGFEALLLGKRVNCFGMPFYAGWGLTNDRKACPRRKVKRTVAELFAAAYLIYPRYLNPVTGELTDIFEVIRLLSLQRRQALFNRGFWAVVGFSMWKHPQARAFLGTPGAKLRFFWKTASAQKWAGQRGGRVLGWSSKMNDAAAAEGEPGYPPLVRMEDGFFRSVGLGSDFRAPYSLVLDSEGIYYDPRRPSRLERILAEYDFESDPELLAKATALRQSIIEMNLTKYNRVGREDWTFSAPAGRQVILVPGQVEDDASIRLGAPEVKTNLALLKEVRAARPADFIIYKPHPDVEAGNRQGAVGAEKASEYADLVLKGVSLTALWGHIHEVHTMTSQVGFEALLRSLPCFTYGLPFYAGWGLTGDRLKAERRGRSLRLDELVAGALILYPCYYDWGSGNFCGPEDVLTLLAGEKVGGRRRRKRTFLFNLGRECYNMAKDLYSTISERRIG